MPCIAEGVKYTVYGVLSMNEFTQVAYFILRFINIERCMVKCRDGIVTGPIAKALGR